MIIEFDAEFDPFLIDHLLLFTPDVDVVVTVVVVQTVVLVLVEEIGITDDDDDDIVVVVDNGITFLLLPIFRFRTHVSKQNKNHYYKQYSFKIMYFSI